MRLKLLGLLATLSVLSACTTTENPPQIEKTEINTKKPLEMRKLSAKQALSRAQLSEGQARIDYLKQSQQQALIEQNWDILTQASEQLLTSTDEDKVYAELMLAYAEQQQRSYNQALTRLIAQQDKLSDAKHYYWHQLITGQLYAAQQLPKQALPYLFRASQAAQEGNLDQQQLAPVLWHTLQRLTLSDLAQFEGGSDNQQAWLQLAKIKQAYLGNPTQLQLAIDNWQSQHPNHLANNVLHQGSVDLQLEPYYATNLAVILPTSGKHKALGEAVKNGILAALDTAHIANTYFIDSALPVEEIKTQLSNLQVNFVIGPLLKNKVMQFEQQQTLGDIPAIYLNSIETAKTANQHYYFSLAPEHEIDQAIAHFMAKGYQTPLLLAPNTNAGKRLVNYFTTQWQRYNHTQPVAELFNNKKQMGKVVKKALGVDKSQQRIKTISRLFEQKVESEHRSRRDIDVAYLLGNTVETRLLKPYLDVNVSTFVDKIPLYASSKSYSKKIDKTDQRDLAGLYFTEQPWLLASNGSPLRKQYQQLWGQQSDLQQRLFAFGYDALSLIPHLHQLSQLPAKKVTGLTGQLSVTDNNEVTRQLQWARYGKTRIKALNLQHINPAPLFLQQSEQADEKPLEP